MCNHHAPQGKWPDNDYNEHGEEKYYSIIP